MSIKSKVSSAINGMIRRGYWYNNTLFADCRKFWSYRDFNTEVMNLGSTSAVNAFCYEGLNVKAANFALSHHPLSGDIAILKNYFSYLKQEGGIVIVPLCPFSSLSGNYQCTDDKYYTLLYPSTLPYYSPNRYEYVKRLKSRPLFSYTFIGFVQDIKKAVCKSKSMQLTEGQMTVDADRWMKSWMKEFSINDFETPLSLYNRDAIETASNILNEIISFCKERNIRPCLLIPPVYHTLGDKLKPEIRKLVIDSLLERVEDKTVWYHNYMDDPSFTHDITLFRNSFLMNEKGAKLFTKKALIDIGLL